MEDLVTALKKLPASLIAILWPSPDPAKPADRFTEALATLLTFLATLFLVIPSGQSDAHTVLTAACLIFLMPIVLTAICRGSPEQALAAAKVIGFWLAITALVIAIIINFIPDDPSSSVLQFRTGLTLVILYAAWCIANRAQHPIVLLLATPVAIGLFLGKLTSG